jgi:hypothetical protein
MVHVADLRASLEWYTGEAGVTRELTWGRRPGTAPAQTVRGAASVEVVISRSHTSFSTCGGLLVY